MRKLISFLTVVSFFIFYGNQSSANDLPILQSGLQNQALPDITVTESLAPSDFTSGSANKIALRFPDGVEPVEAGKVVVSSGDLVIDPAGPTITEGIDEGAGLVDSSHYYVWCRVTSPGTKPSSITFQGIKVTLDRTVVQGDLKIWLTGDYLNQTQSQFPGDNDPSYTIATLMPLGAQSQKTASFVIGKSTYHVDGIEKPLDAVPFIDSAGRTLLPIRPLAESMGAFVSWDPETQTASILKAGSAVSIQVGSQGMNVNGVLIHMDTTAVNRTGRVFLPFRPIAEALGAKVDWNGATQTLTLTIGSNSGH